MHQTLELTGTLLRIGANSRNSRSQSAATVAGAAPDNVPTAETVPDNADATETVPDNAAIPAAPLTDEAFADLVKRHGNAIYQLALSRLRNVADAEDVCQTVFLHLYRRSPAFENVDHERAWLLRVTVNCCNDAHRSPWRQRVLRGERAEIAAEASLDRDSLRQHREAQASRDLADRIDEAMGALTEKQRTVVHLYYFEDRPTSEIAQITGERPATVRSHLRRARKALQRQLGELL